MKKHIYCIALSVSLFSCKKKEMIQTEPAAFVFVAPDSFSEINSCDPNLPYTQINFLNESFAIRLGFEFETTQNGCATWQSKNLPGECSPLGSYIVSKDKFYIYNNMLQYTADGGNSFEVLDSTTITHDLTFLTPNIGIKTGQGIYKTTDGGHTWLQTYIPTGFNGAKQIQFPTSMIGYSNVSFSADGNRYGEIIKTTDGGSTWQTVFPDAGFAILDIDFVTSDIGYFSTDEGSLYRTIDGGSSWSIMTNLNTITTTSLLDIEFVSKTEGYAWGEGIVYLTRDSGLTWQLVLNSNCNAVLNIQLVGNKVYISSTKGQVFKSIN